MNDWQLAGIAVCLWQSLRRHSFCKLVCPRDSTELAEVCGFADSATGTRALFHKHDDGCDIVFGSGLLGSIHNSFRGYLRIVVFGE